MFKYFNQVGVDLIDMKGFLVFQHDSQHFSHNLPYRQPTKEKEGF